MTCYLIAHSLADEEGSAKGGHPGDQTGHELCAQPFFESGWTHLYRANNAEKAEQIADFMEKAVANGYIGYDQSQRITLFNAIYPDFKVEKLTDAVECDCSSLVYCAVYSAYRVPYSNEEANAPLVKDYEKYLLTGELEGKFEKIQPAEGFITSEENLVRGDILIKDGHMAVWI